MYLKTLTLRNFRRFDELTVDFDRRLSVLVGANGAGKTAVLEGAAIALGAFFVAFDDLTGLRIDKRDARRVVYSSEDAPYVQTKFPVEISTACEINERDFSWSRALNGEKGSTTVKDAKSLIDYGKEFQNRLRDGDFTTPLPLIAYYGTGRIWDYHREKRSDVFKARRRTNGYIDSLDGTANLKLMMNWFKAETVDNYQRQEIGKEPSSRVAAVLNVMEQCYRETTGYSDVKIQYKLSEDDFYVSAVERNDCRIDVPLSQLSDGYKSTISLVADMAYRMVELNPQFGLDAPALTDGVVLIDEVDLHLHPAWQQRVLADLQRCFPKIQFIVSTHAPVVISSVHSENLIKLDASGARAPVGEVYGSDANGVIRGLMNANERPEGVKKQFQTFYDALANGQPDLAEETLDALENDIGIDDPDLSACRMKLKLARLGRIRRD